MPSCAIRPPQRSSSNQDNLQIDHIFKIQAAIGLSAGHSQDGMGAETRTYALLRVSLVELPQHLRLEIPTRFGDSGRAWLLGLQAVVDRLVNQWDLQPGYAYSRSNVSLAMRVESRDYGSAVLKIPSIVNEGHLEAAALSLWNVKGAVRLYAADVESGAMLLERCEPGDTLESCRDFERIDDVTATIFHGLPRVPTDTEQFPSLGQEMLRRARLARERFEEAGRPIDPSLMELAVSWAGDLATDEVDPVLLHGDLHPYNILAASRRSWLAIDPIPMVGDRTYDLVQFLLFRRGDLADPHRDLRMHLDRIAAWANLDPVRLARFAVVKLLFDVFLSFQGSGEIKFSDVVAAQQFLAAAPETAG